MLWQGRTGRALSWQNTCKVSTHHASTYPRWDPPFRYEPYRKLTTTTASHLAIHQMPRRRQRLHRRRVLRARPLLPPPTPRPRAEDLQPKNGHRRRRPDPALRPPEDQRSDPHPLELRRQHGRDLRQRDLLRGGRRAAEGAPPRRR